MIQLNGNTHKLQCVMGGAAATTNPSFWVAWARLNATALETGDAAPGSLNGASDVDLVAGVASRQIVVKALSVYNRDTAAVTLTFKLDVSGTDYPIFQCTLQPGESVQYGEGGWRVHNTTGNILAAIAAAGSTTQVQYNLAGVLTGDAGNTWNPSTQTQSYLGSNPSEVMAAGALPSAPSSGRLTRSVKAIAGRQFPFVTGPSGVARCVEIPEITAAHRKGWVNGTGSAGLYFGMGAGTNAGTAAQVDPTLTNKYTAMQRCTYASVVTTQNQQVGIRTGGGAFYRGNAAGLGGFFFVCRFGFTSIKTGCRAFVGLSSGTSAVVTGDPSGLTNIAGFAFDLADTAWTFMHNDAAGSATKDAIAGQATLATNNTAFDAYIFCYPNDNTIYYRLDDVIQGTTLVDTSTSSDLPVNSTGLNALCVMSNGTANTTAGDATIGVGSMVIYTER